MKAINHILELKYSLLDFTLHLCSQSCVLIMADVASNNSNLLPVEVTSLFQQADVGIATVELKIFWFNCFITQPSLGRLFTGMTVTIMNQQDKFELQLMQKKSDFNVLLFNQKYFDMMRTLCCLSSFKLVQRNIMIPF